LVSYAIRVNNVSYCSVVSVESTRNGCYAEVAYALKDPIICEKATTPLGYCLYLIITSEMKIEECDKINYRPLKRQCYLDIANKSGAGIEICDTIPENLRTVLDHNLRESCKELMTNPN
jgi:hypothetical protein